MDISDSYKTLELEKDATLDDVRKAYKDMVRVWHPDRFSGNPRLRAKANEKLKAINLAYSEIRKFREKDFLIRSYKKEGDPNVGSRPFKEKMGLLIRHIMGSFLSHLRVILLNVRFKEYYAELMFSDLSGPGNPGSPRKKHRENLRTPFRHKDCNRPKRKRFSDVMDEIAHVKRRKEK